MTPAPEVYVLESVQPGYLPGTAAAVGRAL